MTLRTLLELHCTLIPSGRLTVVSGKCPLGRKNGRRLCGDGCGLYMVTASERRAWCPPCGSSWDVDAMQSALTEKHCQGELNMA